MRSPLPARLPAGRLGTVRRLAILSAIAMLALGAGASPAFAHAGFSSYAGFAYQPNPLGSASTPYAPGTRYTLTIRAAVETTQPYNGSDDTNVKVTINVPTEWLDPSCGSAMLQVNNAGTGYTNQPGAAVSGWSCAVVTVGSNRVVRFTGPQVTAPATKADSAQFFSLEVTTPSPSTRTAYSGADGTQGFIVDQTYASGANSHWYPNAAYQGTTPEGTTRSDLATGLVRTVDAATVPASPMAPTGVRAGSGAITLRWSAPANGGAPISGYTVEATPQSGGATRTCTATGGSTSCTVTGLANLSSYTFRVRATNGIGDGPFSPSSQALVPAGAPASAPGAPAALTVESAENGAFTVAWDAPIANGGSSITGYIVTATASNQITRTCQVGFGQPRACTLSPITDGVRYSISVVAMNSIGSSRTTSLRNQIASSAPAAPTSVTAGQASVAAPVRVTWTAGSNNGSAITGYTVTVWQGNTQVVGRSCSTTGTRSCSISGLPAGSSFTFRVVATNAKGSGPAGVSPAFTTRT